MSSNEIELTFIRCQNCKSLMPSTSLVCGMCGHQRSSGESSEQKSKNRLRQQSDYNISDSLEPEQDLSESRELKEQKGSESFTLNKSKDRFVTSSREATASHEGPSENGFKARGDKESSLFQKSEKVVNQREEKREYPKNEPLRFGQASVNEKNDDDFEEEDGEYEDDYSGEDYEASSQEQSINDSLKIDRPQKKRRRRKKKKNNNFQNTDSIAPQSEYRTPIAREEKALIEDKVNFSKPEAVSQETKRYEEPKLFSQTKTVERQEFVAPSEKPKEEKVQMEGHISNFKKSESTPSSIENRNQSSVDGQLVGWLVNFSTNKLGSSFELRIGRRFIGRQSLRNDDLIIQDSAVSTPHALLHVDSQQVVIQDLMSEAGTFYKSLGSYDYVRAEAATKLKHGDILKLGNYELIVCLVPRS